MTSSIAVTLLHKVNKTKDETVCCQVNAQILRSNQLTAQGIISGGEVKG